MSDAGGDSLWRLLADSRRWWVFSVALLALAAGWSWAARVPAAASADRIPSPREGFPAPNFNLVSLDGQPTSLDDQRGKVVIVNLWASWCTPCRAEMPTLQKVYEANRARGLVVLGVNSTIQDGESAARKFAAENGLTFPILLDADGSMSRRYLLRALPSTFIVDREGVIHSVIVGGPVSEAVLQSKIESLLLK